MKNNLFLEVVLKGMLGALIGIVGGFLLGFVIYGFASIVPFILRTQYPYNVGPEGSVYPILGMCFGALIGSFFGAMATLKAVKK